MRNLADCIALEVVYQEWVDDWADWKSQGHRAPKYTDRRSFVMYSVMQAAGYDYA